MLMTPGVNMQYDHHAQVELMPLHEPLCACACMSDPAKQSFADQ